MNIEKTESLFNNDKEYLTIVEGTVKVDRSSAAARHLRKQEHRPTGNHAPVSRCILRDRRFLIRVVVATLVVVVFSPTSSVA